jgi:hypothetical protein
VQPTLEEEIKKTQHKDKDLMKIHKHTGENKALDFKVDDKGTLCIKIEFVYPKKEGFKN